MKKSVKRQKEKSLASGERLSDIELEAELELEKIKPEIERLEKQVQKLNELRQKQFKLKSLILSLKSINKYNDVNVNTVNDSEIIGNRRDNEFNVTQQHNQTQFLRAKREIFLPDEAVSHVRNILRTRNNLNYEIFKAIVFNSGYATTEELKKYLVENNIRQPQTGKPFDDVELKEISSRANYLVRKNILTSPNPGLFKSVFGWQAVD